jgi:hypothetical protein
MGSEYALVVLGRSVTPIEPEPTLLLLVKTLWVLGSENSGQTNDQPLLSEDKLL